MAIIYVALNKVGVIQNDNSEVLINFNPYDIYECEMCLKYRV